MNNPTLPNVTEVKRISATEYVLHVYLSPELLHFSGHFPNMPILPGVVQIHWAIHFAKTNFPNLSDDIALQQIKFARLINPGQAIALHLLLDEAKQTVSFSYQEAGQICSSGKLVFCA